MMLLFSFYLFRRMIFRFCFLAVITIPFTTAMLPPSPVYQEVVEVGELPLAQLRQHTVAYLEAVDKEKPKRQRGQWQANADSTQFFFTDDFLLYNRKSVKHPVGAITYRTTIDLKAGKYRYTADSAYFKKYDRNRYSRYVPSRGPAVVWKQAQLDLSAKEQQHALHTLDSRFQSLRDFVRARVQQTLALPVASDTVEAW